jgi:hypothetical protein
VLDVTDGSYQLVRRGGFCGSGRVRPMMLPEPSFALRDNPVRLDRTPPQASPAVLFGRSTSTRSAAAVAARGGAHVTGSGELVLDTLYPATRCGAGDAVAGSIPAGRRPGPGGVLPRWRGANSREGPIREARTLLRAR